MDFGFFGPYFYSAGIRSFDALIFNLILLSLKLLHAWSGKASQMTTAMKKERDVLPFFHVPSLVNTHSKFLKYQNMQILWSSKELANKNLTLKHLKHRPRFVPCTWLVGFCFTAVILWISGPLVWCNALVSRFSKVEMVVLLQSPTKTWGYLSFFFFSASVPTGNCI